MRIKIVHKGLIYLLLPLVIQGLFFWQLFKLVSQTEKSIDSQSVHINISREMDFIIIQFCHTLASFSKPNSQKPGSLQKYKAMMDLHLARLEANIKNTSGDYQHVFYSSKKLVDAQYKLLAMLEEKGDSVTPMDRLFLTKDVIANSEAYGPTIYASWLNEEKLVEEERVRERASREKIKRLILICTAFDFLLGVVFIAFFIKNITQRLNLLVENAKALPTNNDLPNKVTGGDEIAFLDRSMHDASNELKKAAMYRRSLVEMLAHDLRNPLMAIGLAFEVMLKNSKDGQVTIEDSRIKSLRQSQKQLTSLLEDLLTLDRMEATELHLDLTLVKARNVVHDTCDLVKAQADDKAVRFETEVNEDAAVIGDHHLLVQVLGNLAGNAIRYSPPGGTVTLRVRKEDTLVLFSVADEGPGVPKELQKQVFEKFFQVKNESENTRNFGHGLGLAICKQIIDAHGGEIGVTSESGKGARFWFSLRADEDDEDDEGN